MFGIVTEQVCHKNVRIPTRLSGLKLLTYKKGECRHSSAFSTPNLGSKVSNFMHQNVRCHQAKLRHKRGVARRKSLSYPGPFYAASDMKKLFTYSTLG